jgi:hypothetical protein
MAESLASTDGMTKGKSDHPDSGIANLVWQDAVQLKIRLS